MPSGYVFNTLLKKGLNLETGLDAVFNRNDSLECQDDLNSLYTVLSKFRDINGHHPVFTAIGVVANPNFQKIREAEFSQYFYEPFVETLSNYGREGVFELWLEGINSNLFVPQFHGREHLNVPVWLKALQEKDEQTHLAFSYGMWGFKNRHPTNVKYQAAFDLYDPREIRIQESIVLDGLELFERLFGYRARFFVPPNGPINRDVRKAAAKGGIEFVSTSKIQDEPLGFGRSRRIFHYLGQENEDGQIYLTRNCFFEPSHEHRNWVNECLRDISNAFLWCKPAIISSHRVNYIGSINEKNRKNGLRELERLLVQILTRWPEVEFMTSAELGRMIKNAE